LITEEDSLLEAVPTKVIATEEEIVTIDELTEI